MGKDGKPVTEVQEIQVPAFKIVSVFDVSQTEGEPLPSIGVEELTGSVERYGEFFQGTGTDLPGSHWFRGYSGRFPRLLPPDGKADCHSGGHERITDPKDGHP